MVEMYNDKKDKKRKKIIFIIIFFLVLLFLFFYLLSLFNKVTFYEYGKTLYETINEEQLSEGQIDEDYLDESFNCDEIVYEDGVLKFYNCDVEDNVKEDYCVYDGREFDCNVGSNNFSVEFNSNYISGYTNSDVDITLQYDDNNIDKLLYCTSTDGSCVPVDLYKNNIVLKDSSISNQTCVKAIFKDNSTSDIICSDKYMIDKELPVINDVVIDGILGLNGYYRSDVVIRDVDANDNLSGIKEINVSLQTVNFETTGETVVVEVSDNAGNVTKQEITIKVDKTNPVAGSIVIEGEKGLNGWYTSDLIITSTSGSDLLSGYNLSTLNMKSITSSTKETTVLLTTYDRAGNKDTVSQTVKVDKESPIISGLSTINIKPGEVLDLLKGVFATDSVSGVYGNVEIVSNTVDTTNSGIYEVVYRAVDNAGNESLVNRQVIVSAVPLTATFNVLQTPNNGWYNSNVEVEANIVESVTDIKYCITNGDICVPNIAYTTKVDIVEEGNNKVCINAINNGSLSETVCSDIYRLDKTKPSISNVKINNVDPKEWYNTDVVVTSYDAVDSLSDIASIDIINNNLSTETNGEYITIRAVDNAGNVSEEKVLVKIDKTKPVINYTLEGTKGLNDWYITDVEIKTMSATDNLSGVKTVVPNQEKFTEETTGTNLVITATDNAGNVSEETISLKIDKSGPVINSYDLDGTIGEDGWFTSIVTLKDIVAIDNISGINQNTVNNINLVINEETKGKTYEFQVTNLAGLVTTTRFDVKIDLLEPNSGDIILDGVPGNDGWYVSDVTVENTSGSDSISGLKESILNIDINSSVTTTTTVELKTYDNAGHETVLPKEIKIDKTFPVLGPLEIEGTLNPSGWYTTDVTIANPAGTDSDSGIAYTSINITSITSDTPGTTINISIEDIAGNRVDFSEVIKIDKTVPTISLIKPILIEEGTSVDLTSMFNTSFGISDGGVTCVIDNDSSIIDTSTLGIGNYPLVCTATSNAGLSSSVSTTIEVVDTYTEVAYIESDGNQYIASGLMNTGDYIFEEDFMYTSFTVTAAAPDGGSWLYGGRLINTYTFGVYISANAVLNGYGGATGSYTPKINANEWYTMEFSRFSLIINDRTYPVSGQKLIPEAYETEIWIGGNPVNWSGGPDVRFFVGRRNNLKVTDAETGKVVRDFIAVKMNVTGEIGYWDLIEGKFYGSDGSREFIAP